MVGVRGPNTAPATPMMVNAPAMVTSPFAIASQLIAPRIARDGVSTAIAAEATSKAAEPARVPFMRFNAIESSASAPPMTTSPLAISSQDIPPILPSTCEMISRAAPTTTRPAPTLSIFLGITLTAMATSAKAPPIAARPFPICSHDIWPKSDTAEANIFIAAPIAISDTPVDTIPFALPFSLVNAVISARSTPIPPRPLAIPSQLICPKSLQADARILIAADRITMPVAVVIVLPLNLAVLRNISISPSRTPTPSKPLPSSSQLS